MSNERMNLIVLGSGGCTVTPRPGCQCPICKEAREKGRPYARTGPSLFLEGVNVLFDTPEEISHQLNRENIQRVDYIFYTHWHPDHTFGMRVVEQLNMEYLRWYVERKLSSKKVKVCALPEVMNDLKAIKNKDGSWFDYYERYGLTSSITLKEETPFKIKDFKITPIPIGNPGFVSTMFVITHNNKKVAYAPCDCKPFPTHDMLKDLDVLLIGMILPEGILKHGYIVPEDNKLRKEAFTMDDLKEIIATLKIKRTVAVHIEEEFGRSFDDYKKLEEEYREYNIQFAFDGMKIEI